MDKNLISLILLQLQRSHFGCELVVTGIISTKHGFVVMYDRIPDAGRKYDHKVISRLAFVKINKDTGDVYIPNDIITE